VTLKGYITVADLAERLSVSQTRIRQMILNGQIAAEKIGQYKFIAEAEAKRLEKIERAPGRPKKQ
jgi:excisionase family DNA binding protein